MRGRGGVFFINKTAGSESLSHSNEDEKLQIYRHVQSGRMQRKALAVRRNLQPELAGLELNAGRRKPPEGADPELEDEDTEVNPAFIEDDTSNVRMKVFNPAAMRARDRSRTTKQAALKQSTVTVGRGDFEMA